MKPERYLTCDKRVLYRQETNKHHVAYIADWYRGVFERQQFREMGGMVLRLAIKPHRELHANVEPPKKPNPNLMRVMYNYNNQLDIPDPYERFESLNQFLYKIATNSGNSRNREDAYWLNDNFNKQLVFINEGKLIPYYGENNGIH